MAYTRRHTKYERFGSRKQRLTKSSQCGMATGNQVARRRQSFLSKSSSLPADRKISALGLRSRFIRAWTLGSHRSRPVAFTPSVCGLTSRSSGPVSGGRPAAPAGTGRLAWFVRRHDCKMVRCPLCCSRCASFLITGRPASWFRSTRLWPRVRWRACRFRPQFCVRRRRRHSYGPISKGATARSHVCIRHSVVRYSSRAPTRSSGPGSSMTPNLSLNPDASPAALRAVRSAPVSSVR
jgi:hypothetical protein